MSVRIRAFPSLSFSRARETPIGAGAFLNLYSQVPELVLAFTQTLLAGLSESALRCVLLRLWSSEGNFNSAYTERFMCFYLGSIWILNTLGQKGMNGLPTYLESAFSSPPAGYRICPIRPAPRWCSDFQVGGF